MPDAIMSTSLAVCSSKSPLFSITHHTDYVFGIGGLVAARQQIKVHIIHCDSVDRQKCSKYPGGSQEDPGYLEHLGANWKL